jgi:purine-nucleoside phosphorylase
VTDLDAPGTDPREVAREAARRLADLTGAERHDVALVLGSGWGPAAGLLGETLADVPAAELPGFHASGIAGHSGSIRSVAIGGSGRRALVLGARTHY